MAGEEQEIEGGDKVLVGPVQEVFVEETLEEDEVEPVVVGMGELMVVRLLLLSLDWEVQWRLFEGLKVALVVEPSALVPLCI